MFKHKLGAELMSSGKNISNSLYIYLSIDRDVYINMYVCICIKLHIYIHVYVYTHIRVCLYFNQEQEWGRQNTSSCVAANSVHHFISQTQ